MTSMKAAISVEPGRIALGDQPVRRIEPPDALLRVTPRRARRRRRDRGARSAIDLRRRPGVADVAARATRRFRLDDIEAACALYAHRRDGVLEVTVTPP